MTYGYARVSSIDQNLSRQIIELKKAGVDEIITDKQSGKDFDRKGYQEMVSKLTEGDIVVVYSLDRLGRNYDDIRTEWDKITRQIGADIKVLDMPILDTSKRTEDLDRRFIADLVLQILTYVSEKERINIKARQRQGIDAALARGVKFGRPNVEIPPEYRERVARGELSVTAACRELGISRGSWYK